ncbi:hypothetical protein C8A05DRAFT_20437 [Staphylotrichum tortipilum]|uniref:Uncharacterized protein n=1 Tax=Staphylotrichum tortipilum TaxID=2831512 RepID=A0AAN6RM18_9PEZI|nr:hypothetical protein C8A05DRAFT_20437 [Staphylotrichum longicolle]
MLQGTAEAWGLSMTQDDYGRWKTRDHPDEPIGPNTTFLQKQVDYLRTGLAEAESELALSQGRSANLEEEVFHLNNALSLNTTKWEGPLDDCPQEDLRDDEIRNPEREYRMEQEKRRLQGKAPQDWKEYWSEQPYFSKGRPSAEVDWSNAQAFRFATGDSRRLHPGRTDHTQVPWFQCVTDICAYHYKEKLANDHWPVRTLSSDGLPEPLTWTFDHGQGPEGYLWTYRTVTGGRIRAQPRRAWPEVCTQTWTHDQCPDRHCVFHVWTKAFAEHDRHQAQPTSPRRQRDRQAARAAYERMLAADASTTSPPDHEHGGDVPHDSHDLGNGSGAASGPSKH